ncbi:MAG TPA: SOS response-associated peptidase [Candidatus Binataceae bacterium]
MCGRFTLTMSEAGEIAELLGVEESALAGYKPRYNIAPTQDFFVVRIRYENREVVPARWGLINFGATDPRLGARQINAGAETVNTRAAFRDSFLKRRCIVPADGFYEWIGPKSNRRPLWFHRKDRSLFFMAGLYERWHPAPDQWQTTFTIITCGANSTMAPYHDRMPVILPEDRADDWMDPRNPEPRCLKGLLKPPPDDLLVSTPASTRINNSSYDEPDFL